MSCDHRIRSIFCFAQLCVWLLIVAASATAQNQHKVLQWSDHPLGSHHEITEPPHKLFKQIDSIEIQDITLRGKSITIGQPFLADDNWLRDLVFRVKNTSVQELVAIQITLRLPEVKKPPQVPYVGGCWHDQNQACIRPGEEVELKLPAGGLYDWVKRVVATETDLNKISKVTIYVVLVVLPGDVQWSSGCVKTTDPKNSCPVHIH